MDDGVGKELGAVEVLYNIFHIKTKLDYRSSYLQRLAWEDVFLSEVSVVGLVSVQVM